mmetsp:Transcript_22473/g.48397  ORF Transcript_22473/g.48397 Transcript_22473/m.48397 type:complete len:232 (-) Transcript_22473:3-698(-)
MMAILHAKPKEVPDWATASDRHVDDVCKSFVQSASSLFVAESENNSEPALSASSCCPMSLTTVSGSMEYIPNATTAAALTQRNALLAPYSSTTIPPSGAPSAIPNATHACCSARALPRNLGVLFAKSVSMPRSPASANPLPRPRPSLASTRVARLFERAVPTSDTAMQAMPPIMAPFLPMSAYSPATLLTSSRATAGALITMPLEDPERPMLWPYSGIVGMTAPTPMKRMN